MKSRALFVFWLAASLYAQQAVGEEDRARFRAVDIYVDTKSAPLAAYQLEFSITNSSVKIVGIEGGETRAFTQPPFYDPKAMQHERVIIAAFSTLQTEDLPRGKTRVATIHLECRGSEDLLAVLNLRVAADSEARKIIATADFEERKTK